MATTTSWKRLLAEFLAIFAGIVLGLLADDWRQGRVDQVREEEALGEILADLAGDSAELARVEARGRAWDESGLWVAKHRGAAVEADSAVSAIGQLFFITYNRPQRAAYSGLRDAGELGLIRDRELRRLLVEYFEVQQPYIETLYGGGARELYYSMKDVARKYIITTIPDDAISLRDRVSLRLTVPWAEASADVEFTGRIVQLGTFGATVALRTPAAMELNRNLRRAITGYLSAEGSR